MLVDWFTTIGLTHTTIFDWCNPILLFDLLLLLTESRAARSSALKGVRMLGEKTRDRRR